MKWRIWIFPVILFAFWGCENGDGGLNKLTKATLIDGAYKVSVEDAVLGGEFGASLASLGSYLAVGAPFGERVYLFMESFGGYSQVGMVASNNGFRFGRSVGLSNGFLAVGAPLGNQVYLYLYSGEQLFFTAALQGSDTASGDRFGSAVAMAGEYLAVGAPYNDGAGTDAGAVYLFKNSGSGYDEVARLTPQGAGELFGQALAIDGEYLLVGASGKDPGGGAYLFKNDGNDTLSQISLLALPDGSEGDGFGESVALDGNYTLVGAPGRDGAAEDAGAAYLFKNDGNDTMVQVAELILSDAGRFDLSAGSVALEGSRMLIGSSRKGDKGAVYLFEYDGNVSVEETEKFAAGDGEGGDWFGSSVLLNSGRAYIGAPWYNQTGAVYYKWLP